MPRINPLPPTTSTPHLEAVKRQLGVVPNLFRTVGQSPAALEGLLGLLGATAKSSIDAGTRERLAITVAEANGCSYCLSAHTYLGSQVAKLDAAELEAARDARSSDAKVQAALWFARRIVDLRGHVTDQELAAARAAGWSDAQLMEIVAIVALNTLTNYANSVAETDIDFPVLVATRKAA